MRQDRAGGGAVVAVQLRSLAAHESLGDVQRLCVAATSHAVNLRAHGGDHGPRHGFVRRFPARGLLAMPAGVNHLRFVPWGSAGQPSAGPDPARRGEERAGPEGLSLGSAQAYRGLPCALAQHRRILTQRPEQCLGRSDERNPRPTPAMAGSSSFHENARLIPTRPPPLMRRDNSE